MLCLLGTVIGLGRGTVWCTQSATDSMLCAYVNRKAGSARDIVHVGRICVPVAWHARRVVTGSTMLPRGLISDGAESVCDSGTASPLSSSPELLQALSKASNANTI